MKRKQQTLNDAFRIIEAAAIAGERCPMSTNNGGSLVPANVSVLAKTGRIAIEVSGRNWRRVTILVGPHAGKSTAPNPEPNRNKVFLTIDKRGTLRNGKPIEVRF